MSSRIIRPWFAVAVGLVIAACGDNGLSRSGVDASLPPSPDAAIPDANVPLPDAPLPDAAPFCGDGVRGDAEECDGRDFGGVTCADEGYYGGQLACRPECKIEASGCAGRCGDGEINGPELCDDAVPLTGTCRSRGFLLGTPNCAPGCDFFGCRNDSNHSDEIVLGGRDDTSQLGAALAFAGDIDGDGRTDLLMAAPGEVRVLGEKGAVYLVPGSPEGRATINNAARFVDDSWSALGSLLLDVAPARDIDGDGRADFLISAWTGAGVDIYLVYGRPEPFTGTLKLADLVESGDAARFSFPIASAQPGRHTALGVRDVTGDGRDDLVVAVPSYGGGQGAVYVIPGDPVRYSGTLVLPAPVSPLPLPVHAVIVGAAASDALGSDLAAGDLDGDGVADLFVTRGGDVQVFYGPIAGALSPANAAARTGVGQVTSMAVADLDGDRDAELVAVTSSAGYLFRGGPTRRTGSLLASQADLALGTRSGAQVWAGGDVNGDGHPELLVFDALFDRVGVFAGPFVQTDFLAVDSFSARWTVGVFRSSDDTPISVSVGDFNGDGFDDVALGVPRGTDNFDSGHGAVQIIVGATPPAP